MTRQRYARTDLRPEVEQLLAAARAARPGDGPTPIEQLRATELMAAAYLNSGAPAVPVEREIRMETPGAVLRAMLYAPVEEPKGLPVILHMHGGGFVFMLPESFAKPCKEVALGAEAIVVSVDYRRAPEHPYPTPLDDCVAAFRWLREHAGEIGGDPSRIALYGDSAGGGLAASTALHMIDAGEEPPTTVVLACAWLDLRNDSPSWRALGADDPIIDGATMAHWRDSYTDGVSVTDPCLSPLLGDLSSFPPAIVIVGELDPLCDDGIAFAEKLRAAGREVDLHEYEGMPHIFWTFPPLHSLTDATERTAQFFRRRLAAAG